VRAQIQRWGNSLALRIPKSFALELQVEQGSTIDMSLDDGSIVIAPITEPEYSLEELLAEVTRKNRHGEIDGDLRGREVW
jgi:antitoxin MazE